MNGARCRRHRPLAAPRSPPPSPLGRAVTPFAHVPSGLSLGGSFVLLARANSTPATGWRERRVGATRGPRLSFLLFSIPRIPARAVSRSTFISLVCFFVFFLFVLLLFLRWTLEALGASPGLPPSSSRGRAGSAASDADRGVRAAAKRAVGYSRCVRRAVPLTARRERTDKLSAESPRCRGLPRRRRRGDAGFSPPTVLVELLRRVIAPGEGPRGERE